MIEFRPLRWVLVFLLSVTWATTGSAATSAERGDFGLWIVAPGSVAQTGAGGFTGSADEAYALIRASTDDVAEIAASTGLKPANIQKVKDHLFNNPHLLDRYVDLGVPAQMARFDSSADIASAWSRLRTGAHTKADLQLLRHETAEAWFMRRHGPGYNAAHEAAQRRFPANLGGN